MEKIKKIYKNKRINPVARVTIIVTCFIIFLTIAYSSSTTKLTMSGISAIVRAQKDIRITDIHLDNSSSDGISHWEEYNVSNISSGISLPNANSTITYNVKITNIGNMEASVSDITGLPSNLTYKLNNYQLKDMICDDNDNTKCKLGSITTLSITIGYKENGYDSNMTDYTIGMKFTFSYMVDSVAMIENTFYDTLQEAINAVPTNKTETTIKLLNNTSEILTIDTNKNIIMDLNDKTVSNNGNNPVIKNNGTLEIINGTITSNAAANGAINNESKGNITINGAKVIVTGGRQALYNNNGIATIKGASYLSSVSTIRAAVQNLASGTLTIAGGTIISTGSNAVNNAGTMIIGVKDNDIDETDPIMKGVEYGITSTTNYSFYNGTAIGKTRGINNDTRVTDIEDGYNIANLEETIDGEIYQTSFLGITETVTFNPNGGTVSERTRNIPRKKKVGTLPIPTRTGYEFIGWFTAANGGEEIDSNTKITESITFFAHWNRVADVAKIGETTYASIQEAISAAPSGTQTTIKLLKDTKEAVTVGNNKNIIIDLDGKTLSNDGNKAVIENNGTLSIINGTITSNADTAAINNNAGNFTISSGEIIATGTRQAIYITGGRVEITGSAYISSETSGTPTTTTMERGAVQNISGTLIITGGTIIGSKQQAVSNEGILTIGIKDGNINTSTPTLIGKVNGLKTTGTFNFYDGIIKGGTDTINGEITEKETNSVIISGTDTINNESYKTNYLTINQ